MTKTDWAEKNELPSCPGQPNVLPKFAKKCSFRLEIRVLNNKMTTERVSIVRL